MNTVVFSSQRQDWETPQRFFDALHAEFGFTLDACALPHNAKCERFLTPEDDALSQEWRGVVWMNPPYGYEIRDWVKKAYREAAVNGSTVVALIPARTDTSYWHDYVMRAAEVRLVRGRLRFIGADPGAALKGHGVNAPFPNAVVIFKPGEWTPTFSTMPRFDEPATRAQYIDSEVA